MEFYPYSSITVGEYLLAMCIHSTTHRGVMGETRIFDTFGPQIQYSTTKYVRYSENTLLSSQTGWPLNMFR